MRSPLGQIRRRLRWCALVAVVMITAVQGSSFADSGTVRSEGFLPRTQGAISRAANGNMLLDVPARRAYQAVVTTETEIVTFDLDTFARVGSIAIPALQVAQTALNEVEFLWTIDEAQHRILAFESGASGGNGLENYRLLVVDLARSALTRAVTLWPAGDRVPIAMSYHAPSDRIHVLSKLKVEADRRTLFFVEAFTPSGERIWEHRVAACFATFDTQYAPTVIRSVLRDALYLNCYNAGAVQAQVVRLPLDASGAPTGTEEVFPAVPGDLSTRFDPGSDRMFFLTTNSGAGRGAWVFDGLRSTFLGVIATADSRPGAFEYALGLDPATGRLYMQTPAGLVVADARRTPLPAGLIFREYATSGLGSIAVDPVTHRFFVADSSVANAAGHALRYRVLVDSIPSSPDVTPPHPDRLTTDIAEKVGVTDANIVGAARAFGARTLLTGGAQKAAWNVALGRFSPDNLPPARNVVFQTVPLQGGNRDVFAARVRGVTLSGRAADASAIAFEVDPSSERDTGDRGVRAPVDGAECHDDGTAPSATTGTGSTSSTSCDGGGATSVAATADLAGLAVETSGVTVGGTHSSSRVSRSDDRGLVAHSSAVATDVSIAGRVWIDEVRVDAEAWAHGRPGTAGASFIRTITGLRADIDGDGDIDLACGACDLTFAEMTLNTALAGIATVTFPTPDPGWFPGGSPGGYQAIVEKERFRQLASRSLNDDDTTEVAALEIAVYSDGRAGRTRAIVQLAAAQAEAHYGIYALPTFFGPLPPTVCICLPEPGPEIVPPGGGPVPAGPRTSAPTTVFDKVVKAVREGWTVAVTNLDEGLLLGVMWLFFAAPALLALRRRALGSPLRALGSRGTAS